MAQTARMDLDAVIVLHGGMTEMDLSSDARCVGRGNTYGIGGGEQGIQKRADGIDTCIYSGNAD
jgi:hypothetical protein